MKKLRKSDKTNWEKLGKAQDKPRIARKSLEKPTEGRKQIGKNAKGKTSNCKITRHLEILHSDSPLTSSHRETYHETSGSQSKTSGRTTKKHRKPIKKQWKPMEKQWKKPPKPLLYNGFACFVLQIDERRKKLGIAKPCGRTASILEINHKRPSQNLQKACGIMVLLNCPWLFLVFLLGCSWFSLDFPRFSQDFQVFSVAPIAMQICNVFAVFALHISCI